MKLYTLKDLKKSIKAYRKYLSLLVIFLVVCFFYANNTLSMIENTLVDRIVVESREVNPNIKILAIDEDSLESIGKWPWSREILARLAGDLSQHGAKAVWLDILYTEKSSNPKEDEAWADVMKKYDNIYHSAYFELVPIQSAEGPLLTETLRDPVFSVDSAQVGLINTLPDKDGVVRQALLSITDEANTMVPSIDVQLANLLLSSEKQVIWNGSHWLRGEEKLPTNARNQLHFSYASTPREPRFETLPIASVLNGELDPVYFQDSIVLIGPYAPGMSDDLYRTPSSGNVRVYGVEIHANIIQSLYDGELYRVAPQALGIGLIAILTLVAYIFMERMRAKWSAVVFIGFAAGYTVLHIISFQSLSIALPFFYPLLALFLAYVASVVTQYLQERMERGRITGIFGRYVSKGVVKEILENKEEIKLGGVRKDVTLIFVDIRGFTPLSEKMEPENVIQILNEYLDLCTRAVFAYEGTLDKFIGDGVMSIFGAPIEQADHPARAIRAALQMKRESVALAKRLEEKYGRSVSFGVGINSGTAVVGNIGSQDRLDYTAIGDTVNLAARLESNAKPGQILVSRNTYERVKDQFVFTPLEAIKVKGREQWVEIFQVERESGEVEGNGQYDNMESLVNDNG